MDRGANFKKRFYHEFNGIVSLEKKNVYREFFTTLLNLEDGWEVQFIETDPENAEIYISIACRLRELADDQTGELCKVYDHAPEREWRHLDTMQYQTYIKCKLPRIIASNGKVKIVQPIGPQAMSVIFRCLSML